MKNATLEQLEERCAYWQKRLRLQDWKVVVVIQRRSELETENEERAGAINRHGDGRIAKLRILDSIDYPTDSYLVEDQEITLVHELLHIFTLPLAVPDEGPKKIAEEQMINALAEALVILDRESRARGD